MSYAYTPWAQRERRVTASGASFDARRNAFYRRSLEESGQPVQVVSGKPSEALPGLFKDTLCRWCWTVMPAGSPFRLRMINGIRGKAHISCKRSRRAGLTV